MTILETKDLRKVYGSGDTEVRALDGVDLTVEKGEFVAVVGTSGSGKSTLLHMLGGLDRPTGGTVTVDGKELSAMRDEELTIFRRRKIGFVFQNYNLVPVLNVYENIVLPIQLDGNAPDKAYVERIIETLGLEAKLQNLPNNLSGGQQQRVAFARALVMGQEILLLDEPLSNLDAKLRVEVRTELRQIQQKFGITTMYVTHDQDEALSMSDIIAVMRRGRIEQIGSPWEIYFRPATRFVADFVGTVNFLEGTAHREADGSLSVDHRGMRLRVDEDTDLQGGEPVTLVVRPEGISLMGLEETVPEGTALRGTIENYSFLGRMIRYWVRVGEEVFVIDDANVDLTGARTGDVQLRLDTRKLHVLKGGGADAAG